MKKVLSLLFAIMMITPLTVHCEDDITVILNGAELAFDVPPQIIDGRTLVPMRAIFEALGAEVEWSQELQTVVAEKDDMFITMTIGVNVFTVGNLTDSISEKFELDVPPQIIDGRTLVPVRAISESLDCEVEWNGDTRTVIIKSTEPAVTPQPTTPPSDISIEYDDSEERKAPYMRDFKIINARITDIGDLEVTYSLRTFLEGRGTVTVAFNCLDENDNVVDSWTGLFIGTDYTWSYHEDTVTISGKTKKIEFILNQ